MQVRPSLSVSSFFVGLLLTACDEPTAKRRPDEHLAAARSLAESDPEAALAELSKVTDKEPAQVAFLRGTAFENQRKFTDAAQEYEEALRLTPSDGAARFALARVKIRLGQASDSALHLRTILKEQPGWLSAAVLLAVVQDDEEERVMTRSALLAWPGTRNRKDAEVPLRAEYFLALASVADDEKERDLALKRSETLELGSVRANTTLAELALVQGKHMLARNLVKRLSVAAATVDELAAIGEVALSASETSAAARALRRIPIHRRSVPLLILRGRLELKTAHPKRALAQFEGAQELVKSKDVKSRDEVEYWLARAHHADGNPEKAFDLVSGLAKRLPTDIKTQLLMSDLELERGEPQLAAARLASLEQKFPREPEIFLRLGSAQEEAQRSAQAEATYRRYLEKWPGDFSVVLRLVETLRRQGKTVAARQLLTSAHEKQPENIALLRALVAEFIRTESVDEGVSVLKKAKAQAQDPVPVALLLAEVFRSLMRPKSEHEVLRELATEVPTSSRAWTALAQAQLASRDLTSAAVSLRNAQKLAPDSPEVKARLARVLLRLEKSEEASSLLREIAEVPENDVAAQVRVALLHVNELEDPDAALQFAERAYELAPDDAFALDALGWVLLNRKSEVDRERALAHLKRAFSIETDPLIKFHFGAALIRSGRKDEGKNLIRKALQEAEDADWRAAAKSFIVP